MATAADTWFASSRVGTSTIAWTTLREGSIRCRIGNAKAAVLPVPVWAWPMTSRPSSNGGMAAAWIGVGCSNPCASTEASSSDRRPNAANADSAGVSSGAGAARAAGSARATESPLAPPRGQRLGQRPSRPCAAPSSPSVAPRGRGRAPRCCPAHPCCRTGASGRNRSSGSLRGEGSSGATDFSRRRRRRAKKTADYNRLVSGVHRPLCSSRYPRRRPTPPAWTYPPPAGPAPGP